MELEKIKGYLGSLLGGIIATIPWILIYVYAGYLLSILGFVIGYGAIYGYKLFGGKINKNTFKLTMFSTVVAITIATFIIIPLLLLREEGFDANVDNLKILYSTEEFLSSIIGDYIISLLFAVLGASATNKTINNQQVIENKLIDTSNMMLEEKIEVLKKAYEKYNAFDKEHMVSDFKIMKELNVLNKYQFITQMESKGVITGKIGKSYFNKDYLENPEKYKKEGKKKILLGVLLGLGISLGIGLIIAIPLIIYSETKTKESYNIEQEKVKFEEYSYKDLTIKLPNTFVKLNETEESKQYDYIVLSNTKENDVIYDLLLQEIDITEVSSFDEYVNYYKSTMNELMEIKKEEKNVLNNQKYYELRYQDKENKTLFYWTYLINKNNKVYLISFTAYYDNYNIDSQGKQEIAFESFDIVMDACFSTVQFIEKNSQF